MQVNKKFLFILLSLLLLVSAGSSLYYLQTVRDDIGAAITYITATSTIKESREPINTNFSNINAQLLALASSSATTTIGGVAGPNFTFATGSDTNIGLTISTSTGTVTFTPTWSGTLANSRIASSSSWVPYSYGSSTYYLASNPSNYLTATALNPYLSTTTAASTYITQASTSATYITKSSSSATYPTFGYGSSTYYLASNPNGYVTSATSPWGATTTGSIWYAGGIVAIGTTSPVASSRLTLQYATNSASALTFRDSSGAIAFELRSGTSTLLDTFIGRSSGQGITTGSANSALGYQALYLATSSSYSSAFGSQALANAYGSSNTAVGESAFYDLVAGSSNSSFGRLSGAGFTSLSNSTFIGANSGPTANGLTNATAIGYGAQVGASNSLVLGGTGANLVNVGIGTTSPINSLTIVGTAYFSGTTTLKGMVIDSLGSSGSNGDILSSTGTSTKWINTSALPYVSNSYASTTFGVGYWKPSISSSSLLGYNGSTTATTTINIPADFRNITITGYVCMTNSGTSSFMIGNGVATTTMLTCNPQGSPQTSSSTLSTAFSSLTNPVLYWINNSLTRDAALTIRYTY